MDMNIYLTFLGMGQGSRIHLINFYAFGVKCRTNPRNGKVDLKKPTRKEAIYFQSCFSQNAKFLNHISTNNAPHLVVLDLQARLLGRKVSLRNNSPLHSVGDDEHCDQDQHCDGDSDEDHHQHGDLLCVGLLTSICHD